MNEKRLLPGEELPVMAEGKRRRWTCSLPAKVMAFLLLPVLALAAVGCVLVGVLLVEGNVYARGPEELRMDAFFSVAWQDQREIGYAVLRGDYQYAEEYAAGRNIKTVIIYNEAGNLIWRNDGPFDLNMVFQNTLDWSGGDMSFAGRQPQGTYQIWLGLDDTFPKNDEYAFINRLVDQAYALRYWLWGIAGMAVVLAAVCFVFLLCAAGWRKSAVVPQPGWGTRLPLDLLTVGSAAAIFGAAGLAVEATYITPEWLIVLVIAAAGMAGVMVFTGWCMSLALRVKLGQWWKNTILWQAVRLAWRCLQAVGGGTVWFFRWLLGALPMVWKAAAAFGILCLLELAGIMVCWWRMDILALLWAMEKALLLPAVVYLMLMLRRLQKGGEALAAGDLAYQVDTRKMPGELHCHGENLNSIADGMAKAVEQRMRSERLKTELITNVSHDIKTPLTSIISYADLIGREPPGSEKTAEYAAVLLRQSERLKKLIEDLVEASKASTGNLDVVLAPCEAGVLLTQAAGEYERRLEEKGLTLVLRQPEEPVTILADGRRLWRVLDNLMNNICKYGQSGTRVYLALERQGDQVVLSFKNTSAQPLEQSADELLERFVRGDASRSSEGSGLGLSIARSLTELQRGTLELTVDGDLFKVVLRFPVHK